MTTPLTQPWRVPFPVWALAVCLLFAALGGAVFDDYGVTSDDVSQRKVGHATLDYILGKGDARPIDHNRFYTTAFETGLALAERLLGLDDSRGAYLARHLLTHIFFLLGAFFCSLLAYRLSDSRLLALFALVLFLLHPRLYGHSFVNTKDIPFLVMFMVSLYLVHRAFRRDTLRAFLLCGAGVGLLTNFRIMGVLLFAAVLALRACDLFRASADHERRRVRNTALAFAAAGALTLYAVSPWLWRNPFEFLMAVAVLSRYPDPLASFFQGQVVSWPDIPPHYLPVWITITTPPVVLLLGLAGAASLVRSLRVRPRDALRNTDLRFAFLLLACLVLTVLAIVVIGSNLYDAWRHVYFLYAPLCLLALFGLRWLASLCPRPVLRRGVYVLAAAGVAVAAVETVSIHPYQALYFNFLVDRHTPERLRSRYGMIFAGLAYREGFEHLLRRHPSSPVYVGRTMLHVRYIGFSNLEILPPEDRRRIVKRAGRQWWGDYYVSGPGSFFRKRVRARPYGPPFAPVVHSRKLYNNTILTVTAADPSLVSEDAADAYREIYRSLKSAAPVAESDFDLYIDGKTLTYLKEPCRPLDVRMPFSLRVFPVHVHDLDPQHRRQGFEPLPFEFARYGVHIDGKCMLRLRLPDYPVRAIETGQRKPHSGRRWRVAVSLPPNGPVPARVREETFPGASAKPVAESRFDLYLQGDTLAYLKEPCVREDTAARFFLHLVPSDQADLPSHRKRWGYDNLDFHFGRAGALRDGKCLALVELPAYEIARIRTGQFIKPTSLPSRKTWEAEIDLRQP